MILSTGSSLSFQVGLPMILGQILWSTIGAWSIIKKGIKVIRSRVTAVYILTATKIILFEWISFILFNFINDNL